MAAVLSDYGRCREFKCACACACALAAPATVKPAPHHSAPLCNSSTTANCDTAANCSFTACRAVARPPAFLAPGPGGCVPAGAAPARRLRVQPGRVPCGSRHHRRGGAGFSGWPQQADIQWFTNVALFNPSCVRAARQPPSLPPALTAFRVSHSPTQHHHCLPLPRLVGIPPTKGGRPP